MVCPVYYGQETKLPRGRVNKGGVTENSKVTLTSDTQKFGWISTLPLLHLSFFILRYFEDE